LEDVVEMLRRMLFENVDADAVDEIHKVDV
jgi:hypothetical protein